ncbi:MAG: ankyrin repeat domain-containing protein [Acidobacteria bacterium]|nr:ankyrin repeat domain-containing protein [Acidobacteriota bacterium]
MTAKRTAIRGLSAACLLTLLAMGSAAPPVHGAAPNGIDAPAIVDAARAQDSVAVRSLVDAGADVNTAQPDGATALHWAAYRNDHETAALLIDAGADVNAANELGATPVWLAADNGSADMVARLLDAGADPDIALRNGETPVMTASRTGNADAVRLLAGHGADVDAREHSRGQTALMWAVAQGHHEIVDVLLAHGADMSARSRIRPRMMHADATNGSQYDQGVVWSRGGYTPLLFAARHGDVEAAHRLVDAGADIDDAAPTGASALVVAAHSGHADFARFALGAGADPNDIGAGYTPLHAAILRGDLQMATAFLAAGADPNARLERGTPVRRAGQDWAIAPQLVSATPYWLAAYYQEADIMRALVAWGADPRLTTLERWAHVFERAGGIGPPHVAGGFQTPLLAAVSGVNNRGRRFNSSLRNPDREERAAYAAAKVAIEHGTDVNQADHVGTAPLHSAAQRNYATVVELLAGHGADLNLKNGRGTTALTLAERAEARRLERPDITRYPSGNSAQVLRDLGAGKETEETKVAEEWQPQ